MPILRLSATSVLCLSLALAGCSSSGVEALDDKALTTASIPAPTPKAHVSGYSAPEQAAPAPASVAETPRVDDDPEPVAVPVAQPKPEEKPQRLAMASEAAAPVRAVFKRLKIHKPRFRDAKPVNFGRTKPQHYAVHGVDVSRWQGEIDWKTLKRHGANFAYIKATDGTDHKDPNFEKNWKGAAKAGIPRGAYHFFYWCSIAEVQADWFIANVPKEKGALPPVIDVEWNHHSETCSKKPDPKTVLAKMRVFMDKIEKHYGQQPVIYTAPDFYADNLKGQFRNYSFWLRAVAEHPSEVYPGREFAFWQYSGTGLSGGVDTRIDLNVFNGSADGWRKWLGRWVH